MTTDQYRFVSVDTEGALIRAGLPHPQTVCVSIAERIRGTLLTDLMDIRRGAKFFEELLDNDYSVLIFKNSPFDCGSLVNYAPHLMVKVFNKYAKGLIRDIGTRQELLDIYAGRISEGGKTFVFDKGEWRSRDYTLAGLEKAYAIADRAVEKKDYASWRYNFARLAHLPIESWPKEAVDYAKEDAGGTLLVYERQTEAARALPYLCPHATDKTAIVDEINQEKAHWALHLMSAWGLRTDPKAVKELETVLLRERAKARKDLIRYGILKPRVATAAEVKEGKVDFYQPVTKSRKTTKKDVPKANQYIKDGRLYTETNTPHRYAKDTKHLQDLVGKWYKKLVKEAPKTKTGLSTDKDTLYGTGSRLLKLAADGGGIEKIINTYLPVLWQGTQYPINVRYNTLVNSGRTSAFGQEDKVAEFLLGVLEQTGCNIQNLPTGRRVGGTRECFTARSYTVYASVDYKTLELFALAQVCFWLFGKSRMREVLNSGKDLHLAMAADMLHISYQDAERIADKKNKGALGLDETVYGVMRTAILKTFKVDIGHGKGYEDRDNWCRKQMKRSRDCAKVANFGLPGGLGAESLVFYARDSYKVIITKEEARDLIKAWRISWPEMNPYFSYINQKVGHQKELAKLVQFWSGRVRGNMGYTDGCNTLFQGLAADGAKLAMFRIAYEMYCVPSSPLYGSRLVAFIHDEFLAELLNHIKGQASKAAWRLATIAVEEMKKVMPDMNPQAEPALMEKWYKEAELVMDKDGLLIPWRPKVEARA
jgi:hypothetical protein